MTLHRNTIYLIGIGIILLFIGLNRFEHWTASQLAQGDVVGHKRTNRSVFSIVRFYSESGEERRFYAERNYELAMGEKVTVIYKEDGSDAEIFSFVGFFLAPLIYGILPLLVWSAAALSFVSKGESVTFSFKGITKNKVFDPEEFNKKEEELNAKLLTRMKTKTRNRR